VFYKGEIVGEIDKFSDHLLIEILKARRPAKYRQGVGDGEGVKITVELRRPDERESGEVVDSTAVELEQIGPGAEE
jgi:hypothetical protein